MASDKFPAVGIKSTKLPLLTAGNGEENSAVNSLWNTAVVNNNSANTAGSTAGSMYNNQSSNRPIGYAFGVCSQQGKRPYQEDQYARSSFTILIFIVTLYIKQFVRDMPKFINLK